MRVFVTGGSSSLGELVLPRLTSVHEVHALVRSPEASRVVAQRGAIPVHGNLEESVHSNWRSISRSADSVVHLAGMRFADRLVAQLDTEQPLTVISSASLYNHLHPQSEGLRAAEDRLGAAMSGALKILRPTMIYGSSSDQNIRRLARFLCTLPATPHCSGGALIQPVLADDVADAIFETLDRPDRIQADLGARDPVTLGNIVDTLAALLHKPTIPISIPVGPFAWTAGVVSRWRHSSTIHALAMLQHDRSVMAAGESILGHRATPISEGLAIAIPRYQLTVGR